MSLQKYRSSTIMIEIRLQVSAIAMAELEAKAGLQQIMGAELVVVDASMHL